jgi:hypothetical protein
MKTKRTLTALAVLLGVLLGREAQAFYNPSTGRWLSRDPVRELGGTTMALAASIEAGEGAMRDSQGVDGDYLFVRNDPHGRTDCLGLAEVAQNSNCCQSHKDPETDCGKICRWARKASDKAIPKEGFASVVCYGATKCPCVLSWDYLTTPPRRIISVGSCPGLDAIAEAHERDGHMAGTECSKCGLYLATGKEGSSRTAEDCKQRKLDIPKLSAYIKTAALEPGGANCKRAAEILRAKHEDYIKKYCN